VPFTESAIAALALYAWPGNIREMRNVVERLLLLADGEVDADAVRMVLPATPNQTQTLSALPESAQGTLSEQVLAFERAVVLAELETHNRNITRTAKALGLERSHLYKKCLQLGIDLQSLPERE
jgi:DNA-binding NtrC family response regulator